MLVHTLTLPDVCCVCSSFFCSNASVNSKHQHPPRATPEVLHSTAAPGPGFILDDLARGPGFCISIRSHTFKIRSIKEALYKSMLTAKAFQDTRHKLLTAKEQCGMKISYLQKINRACLYSYLIRYQIIWHVVFTKPFIPVFNHYIYRICSPSLS